MIIFRPSPTSSISTVLDQIRSAIDSGIGWIQLPTHGLDEEKAREMAEAAIAICQDYDIILTLENQVETVDKLRNHGVHLMSGSMHPAFVREKLGPHAIIGLQTNADIDPDTLKKLDIDYLTLDENVTLQQAGAVAQRIAECGLKIPVVVTGHYTPDEVRAHSISGILKT